MADSKVSMKLLIDTKGKRVLFAEAGKDCVDFLFHILTLPVATIISLLKAQGMVGSLPNLFRSLETLNDTFIQPDQNKDTFLKPMLPASTSSSIPLLTFTAAQNHKKFYRCGNTNSCRSYVSDGPRATCPSCQGFISTTMTYVAPSGVQVVSEGGGLVKGVVTYMVMDDLEIKPMSTISSITMLNRFNVKEVGALEERVVTLGMKEAVKLLKTSLQSNKVLTDVFFS
ncbi:uncharacterized protein LOC130997142 [Salvia miltiorrhiza]|uniref:uncharacterized protein LOC130997142 n=1 Tax=Salvia miltiorrhiza TaxID=226208 RepID=UPI0025AC828F|nr:uncharacterized protein LOC130997142 [Salvia miltiorrhiza]